MLMCKPNQTFNWNTQMTMKKIATVAEGGELTAVPAGEFEV